MKSDEVILNHKGTNEVQEKNENNLEGKILGLFDDDMYREESKLRRLSSFAMYYSSTFHYILLLGLVGFLTNL